TKGYDECKRWDWLRKLLYDKADACIFYTDYPVKKYEKMGMSSKKMFVAPNTVAVEENVPSSEKDSLLFIGSLYPQKGLGELLVAYKEVLEEGKELPILNVLGSGSEFENIQRYIEENGLKERVFLRGAIYDIQEKAKYFSRALACISPRQAGLAVQESLGYGVPFITHKNAVTGGEVFDVKDGKTGRYFSEEISLQEILEDIADSPEKYIEMGQKAKAFYQAYRKPEDMVNGAWDAIQYAYHAHRKARLPASDKYGR
ncbi:MAG: glycosyltransferase, partial [Opitutales bacterium]|nr:glycosyltransferase [Opitutales bacterium]